ncbi:hypothetical protein HaLaN_32456, partial [Haematococcus lacustris]
AATLPHRPSCSPPALARTGKAHETWWHHAKIQPIQQGGGRPGWGKGRDHKTGKGGNQAGIYVKGGGGGSYTGNRPRQGACKFECSKADDEICRHCQRRQEDQDFMSEV